MRRLLAVGVILLTVTPTARAGTVVATLAAKVAPGVEVHCTELPAGTQGQSYEYEDGTFEPLIELSLDTCRGITRLVEHRSIDAEDSANSLETLLHEASHVSLPTGNEGVAECEALRRLPAWLDRLGYHAWRRHLLISLAWQAHLGLPARYQGDCRPPWSVAVVITGIEPVPRPRRLPPHG